MTHVTSSEQIAGIEPPATPVRRGRKSAARRVLDLFSSVKFGIWILVLLFIYMSVGSAGIVYPTHPNLLHPDAWAYAQLRQLSLIHI